MTETPCEHCERMMQPYLDRVLSVVEQAEAFDVQTAEDFETAAPSMRPEGHASAVLQA